MKFLQIGLGSMGERRIKCLKILGYTDIIGFDIRVDRREEIKEKYSIDVIDNINKISFLDIDSIIISTPPDKHNEYICIAINNNKPVFIEASVILENLEELNKLAKKKKVFVAPSCTMCFHPAIKEIERIVKSGRYGKITNFIFYIGQYLPDWHPWENVKDYYVGNKKTGGAREMVPFDLTWLTRVVGFPKKVMCFYGKTMDIGVDIDDTYAVLMNMGNSIGTILVDVVSRYATRSLILNMEECQIVWRWDENVVKLYEAFNKRWIHYYYSQSKPDHKYNKNISDDMYVNELDLFIKSIKGKAVFLNNLDEDIKILKLLKEIESSYEQ